MKQASSTLFVTHDISEESTLTGEAVALRLAFSSLRLQFWFTLEHSRSLSNDAHTYDAQAIERHQGKKSKASSSFHLQNAHWRLGVRVQISKVMIGV